jgi:hypothetical protein
VICVLVCGGRHYEEREVVFYTLGKLHRERVIGRLIQGGAHGADSLALEWRLKKKIPGDTYLADWKRHGKSAGPIRNARMLVEGKPDLVVAFPGGAGTAHMVRIAREAGVEVLEV